MNYQSVHAFSKNGRGGNPAAVVINSPLSAAERQQLARAIGFSETAFLTANDDKLHIEFYTPEKPIAYCGHATIAAMSVLQQHGLISEGDYQLHTNHDPIAVTVASDAVYMQQRLPDFEPADSHEAAAMLELLGPHVLRTTIARNGVGFLLIELDNADRLYHLKPSLKVIDTYSRMHDLIGVYVWVRNGDQILSRMFAPYYGIPEENATGMASGLLAGWLHELSATREASWHIEQGYSYAMAKRGYLHAWIQHAEAGKHVMVGGEATVLQPADS